DVSSRYIREHVLSAKGGNRLAVVEKSTPDRIAAGGNVTVLDDRICRRDQDVGEILADLNRNLIDRWPWGGLVIPLQQLVSFAQRIAVVAAFVDNVDGFPRMQADGIGDETVVARIGGIDRPTQAMGIPETERPDFFAGSGHRHERIVVGNSVTAIFAY